MKWSSERPTEQGWYWHRRYGCSRFVWLTSIAGGELQDRDGVAPRFYSDVSEWAGPIPYPEEP